MYKCPECNDNMLCLGNLDDTYEDDSFKVLYICDDCDIEVYKTIK